MISPRSVHEHALPCLYLACRFAKEPITCIPCASWNQSYVAIPLLGSPGIRPTDHLPTSVRSPPSRTFLTNSLRGSKNFPQVSPQKQLLEVLQKRFPKCHLLRFATPPWLRPCCFYVSVPPQAPPPPRRLRNVEPVYPQ